MLLIPTNKEHIYWDNENFTKILRNKSKIYLLVTNI